MNELENRYFEKLCQMLGSRRSQYRRLLRLLYLTDFHAAMEKDVNRAKDGISLRSELGFVSEKPCSVLEMMVALAHRIDIHIIGAPGGTDKTVELFWVMVKNLGLAPMDDVHFSEEEANDILRRFQNRNYAPNGKGGLFYIPDTRRDLREVEIWYQAMWYLSKS